jgi:iron-sulfur cluster repair protein YtfE (RIC family)
MPIAISTTPTKPATEDAVDLLLACHERIRNFTATAARLAAAADPPAAEVAQAAAGLLRYFTVALPLHEADENLSMYPRLRDAAPPEVIAALDAMLEEHRSINAVVQRMKPLLQALELDPARLHLLAGELADCARQLEAFFTAHLKLEEEVIFPAIRLYLPADSREAILAEMRQRRT